METTDQLTHKGNEVDEKAENDSDKDAFLLETLGYRQRFRRRFNLWSSFSLGFVSLGLLPSIASTLSYSLG
jgi:hypothetical protein